MFISRIFLNFLGIKVDTEVDSSDSKKEGEDNNKSSKEKNRLKNFSGNDKTKEKSIRIEVKDSGNSKRSKLDIKPTSSPARTTRINNDLEFIVDNPQIKDKGEDAPPLLLKFDDNSYLIAVADGMGGAGGTVYEIDDKRHSGAYLASRAINSIAENYFRSFKEAGFEIQRANVELIASDLKYHFDIGLLQILDKIHKKSSSKLNIKSSMIKRLPTTFALAYIRKYFSEIEIHSLWAGDSRVYLLDTDTGLHQLTKDDLVNSGDAFENLINDSPISNCINADKDYQINSSSISVKKPVIIFSATDGAFGYIQTPVHFEFLLLDSMVVASDGTSWKMNIEKALKEVQADDITISLCCIGFENFVSIKEQFMGRFKQLYQEMELIRDKENQLTISENKIEEALSSMRSFKNELNEIESRIDSSVNSIEQQIRNFNSLEYDIKSSQNRYIEKERELIKLQEIIMNKINNLEHIRMDIDKAQDQIDKEKMLLNNMRKNNPFSEQDLLIKKTKSLREERDRVRKDLWAKYKSEYEQGLQ